MEEWPETRSKNKVHSEINSMLYTAVAEPCPCIDADAGNKSRETERDRVPGMIISLITITSENINPRNNQSRDQSTKIGAEWKDEETFQRVIDAASFWARLLNVQVHERHVFVGDGNCKKGGMSHSST